MTVSEIEEAVLKTIKPSREEYEHVLGVYRVIADAINTVLRKHGVEAEVTLQGSIAHDTWLSGDRDMDVFVLYPESWSIEELKSKGFKLVVEAAEKLGIYELRYAEHPYVRVRISDVEADIVPAFNISDPAHIRTAVDRTPFHTRYIRERLTDEMRDQVRLLKKFMKGIGVYGAEVKTKGFSGYAVEVLIARYNSMRRVLEEASKWNPPVYIDSINVGESFWKGFRKKYPDSVIYMPDPVDPMRNVTANVSMKSLAIFSLASRCYLTHPSLVFYGLEYEGSSIDDVKKKLADRCIVLVEYMLEERLPPDVVWGELNRVRDTMVKLLENFDFHVIDSLSWTDEDRYCAILLELDSCSLPVYKHYKGPSVKHWERSHSFISKHLGRGIGVWVDEKGSLNALSLRRYINVKQILEEESRWYSVAPHFRDIKPSVKALSEEVIAELSGRGALRWISEFILKTPIWMVKCIS
ncbi:CCA tRNA nucleotidyltransferase [Desulfurococcus amylolyticus]|uniref:CCA tRNA nucleotidyltransferase n=1 Tax=Desulfurococcus amylolyticus TaxID=94694 RepID=UPI0005B2115F|nr:CCA tRNA nucleotidyltransferase [Desulfurococcus amylolyticus]